MVAITKEQDNFTEEELRNEKWKPVTLIEDVLGLYEVSNLGRVRSLDRETTYIRFGEEETRYFKGKMLTRNVKNRTGYVEVCLRNTPNKYNVSVHRLVAHEFLGKRPEDLVINHIDENKANNRVENLEYVTVEYNNNWATRNERLSNTLRKLKAGKPILKINMEDEQDIEEFSSAFECQRHYNGYFDRSAIRRCCLGESKQHKGYYFKYKE